jgi:hypothetical protein
MMNAKEVYNKFWDDTKPNRDAYSQFWKDLFTSLGFAITNSSSSYAHWFDVTYTKNGVSNSYSVMCAPIRGQGIWISDNFNMRQKCITETGVFKFCKKYNVGDLT